MSSRGLADDLGGDAQERAATYPLPSNEWIQAQAETLSASKTRDAIGALAWNLAVAFRRWSKEAGR